jgi:transposase
LWIKRYLENGIHGLNRLYSHGRSCKHKNQLKGYFPEWFGVGPDSYGYSTDNWTISLLCDNYQKITNEQVSEDTVARALKEAGYSYRRVKKCVHLHAPTREEKKQRVIELIEEIKSFIAHDESVILSLDKAHFSTEPYLIRGWYKKNSMPHAVSQKEGELHNIWCVEYRGAKVYLEKCQTRKQQDTD